LADRVDFVKVDGVGACEDVNGACEDVNGAWEGDDVVEVGDDDAVGVDAAVVPEDVVDLVTVPEVDEELDVEGGALCFGISALIF